MKYLKNLTDKQKAIIHIAAGVILLLFAMGLFKTAFQYLIVISAILLIVYGIYAGNFITQLNKYFKKDK